jgi:uncharacterized protein with FMN-binding domain
VVTWADAAGLVTLFGVYLLLRYHPAPDPAPTASPAATAQAALSTVLSGPSVPQPPVAAGQAVLGRVVATDFGSLQVQLTVAQGRITSARAVRIPEVGGRQGERINTRAIPILDAETVRAQSARIDAVSGATISSNGYRTSLQSAVDAAHLA